MIQNHRNIPEFQCEVKQQRNISCNSVCQKHRLATRIWRGITELDTNNQTCQCCGRKIGKQHVQTSCKPNSSLFSFLGPGIPLFFKFIKGSIFILVLMTLVFSIFGLYSNIISKNCDHNQNCVVTIFNSMSIVNKKQEFNFLRIQNYILLAFVVCCLILLHGFRYWFRKVDQKIDKLNASASDYAIILKRLPYDVTKEKVQKIIKQQFNRKNMLNSHHQITRMQIINKICKIQQIVLSYDVTNFLAQKQIQLENFKYNIKKDPSYKFEPTDITLPNELGQIVIVVFGDQQTKNNFIHQPSLFQRVRNYFFSAFPPLSDIKIDEKRIAIERAPEPQDIMWQNAHITPCQRTKRKILLNCASFILLMIGGGCQYGLAVWQTIIEDSTTKVLVGTIASITVTVTNAILQQFLIYSTKWERMGTQTEYLEVLTFKFIIQQFLNSGVFVVAASILADFSDSTLQNSLSDTITQIMILNALTPNLTIFIMKNFDLIGKIKRYVILKSGFFITTQLQANKLYELPKPDFTQKYSYIVKTLWLTAFYAPLVPIVVPISAIGLTMNYFVEKYLFSHSYSISSKISSTLNNSCMQGLEYIPLIFSIGQFLIFIYFEKFYEETPSDWLLPIYISLALSFANLILPMQQFNEQIQACFTTPSNIQINEEKIQTEKKTYIQAKQEFQITYQMTYPASKVTRHKRKDTFIEKLFINNKAKVGSFPLNKLIPQKAPNQKQDNVLEPDFEQTPSILQLTNGIHQNTTEFLIINKKTSHPQKLLKFQTEQSITRVGDTQTGSVTDQPLRFMHGEPKPGKLFKQKSQNNQDQNNNQSEEARKLFDYYEAKKAIKKLIQIQQQNEQQQKAQQI